MKWNNLAFRIGIDFAKVTMVLVIVCIMFCFSAVAQTKPDAPLDEEARTALIDQLKEGLPDFIEDKATVNSIVEKWDAHEDLNDKTKSQILEILFEDVKSVVKDEETRKNIWENWTQKEDKIQETPQQNNDSPKPTPPKSEPTPTKWIKIKNVGAFTANFFVTWEEPGKPNNLYRKIATQPGFSDTVYMPVSASNVRLKMENAYKIVFDRVLQPNDFEKCYRLSLTLANPRWDNNCQ